MQGIFDFFSSIFWWAIYIAIAAVILVVWGYNKLRQQVENVKTAESNIKVVTRKKIALVNQLIDVVKGYEASEKFVMLKVSEDQSVSALQQTYQQSGTMLSTVNAMAQRFPDLKSSAQYSRLIDSIQASENDVQNARTRYNAVANEYNVKVMSIPHVFYAGTLGFKKAEYFSMEAEESADAGVQRPMISDDGERLNKLLGAAGAKTFEVAKGLVREGKLMAEKGAARMQAPEGAPALAPPPLPQEEFHYLDADKNPVGPASPGQLKELFRSGAITGETPVLKVGSKDWIKYRELA